MKKSILLLFIGISQLALLTAQETDYAGNIGNLNMDDALTFDNRYSGIKGSPFIFQDYQKARLFTSQKGPIEVNYLNFDRYSRELCYKSAAEKNAIQLNKYLVDSFYVFRPEDTLSFHRLILENNPDYLYMECLYAGKSSLYCDHGKKLNEADYVDPYSADRRYDEFQDMPVFYLQFEKNGEFHPVKKNKKQFSSLFGAHSEQILSYIKSEKSSLKSRENLISLIQYYDRIRE